MTLKAVIREIKFRAWHKKEKKMYYRGYQKWFHVLLCEDDAGKEQGRGIPVKRESFEACELLESTGLEDIRGQEIFEGDIVRVEAGAHRFIDLVEGVPDMFRSRKLHPLHGLLAKHGIADDAEGLKIEVLGNRFENQELAREAWK